MCDTGKGLVGLDAVVAVGFALGGGSVVGDSPRAGTGLLLTGALYAGAALVGNAAVNRCRKAFDSYTDELAALPHPDDSPDTRLRPRRLVPARVQTTPSQLPAATPPLLARPLPPPSVSEPPAIMPPRLVALPAPAPAPPAQTPPAPAPPADREFHVVVGDDAPATSVATPAPAVPAKGWGEFWQEVP